MENGVLNTISWNIINTYFEENDHALISHHIDSYNDFFKNGMKQIFVETNPIRIHKNFDAHIDDFRYKLDIFIGGKDGDKIYYGQPIIYDKSNHYMYPNEARLKNMTYATTVHYDVHVVCSVIDKVTRELKTMEKTFPKIFLGKFPILLHSDMCILSKLPRSVAFQMGECKNDKGGYFIIDGKEKCFIPQEKFADNMLYIKKNDDDDENSHSAIIRTVSEDVSKPERTLKIHIVRGVINDPESTSVEYRERFQIVVDVPNVKKPIPLFILMRALGVISDKKIIEMCLLDLKQNEKYIDLFSPSVHDASIIFTQETALQYIKSFTKQETVTQVYEILVNYLLPNVGEDNFINKAYCIGDMVYKLLKVFSGDTPEVDRDNFKYKRIELLGDMMYDLFKEYYKQQQRSIYLNIERNEIYFHYTNPDDEEEVILNEEQTIQLFEDNLVTFFNDRDVEKGFRKAFKGNWGATAHTKRVGIIQDLNRLSFNSHKALLRKINLPLDASAKIIGPRLLHGSQWGYIDPLDTPDGGNVGTHKHLSIMTRISNNYSGDKFKIWLLMNSDIKLIDKCTTKYLNNNIKVFVNGTWYGVTESPLELVSNIKYNRRVNKIHESISVTFDISEKSIFIYTDSGRLLRPIYYMDSGKLSVQEPTVISKLLKRNLSWDEIVHGSTVDGVKTPAIIDYIDSSESNDAFICLKHEDMKSKSLAHKNRFTHVEIEPSLIFGILGNQVIFPEHNPPARNLFSCGQTKQAVSLYHSNFQNRFDKMGVILNYGQNPIIKSKYTKFISNDEQPHGENTIVAIMSLNGYNVEDAILVNEGSVKRGLFRTTYFTTYETTEESSEVLGSTSQTSINNVNDEITIKLKPGYDYGDLDSLGLIKENTLVNDRKIVIGKSSQNVNSSDSHMDASIGTKKGQVGYVDKTFISDNQEGFRVAKVRIREERIPSIGDKMASRAGQKGTIGLIIPESDMPFTADGIKPDLIINPHAIPSRMTIGQLVEMLLGKLCTNLGSFSDCTAFMNKGGQEKFYGNILTNIGFHSSGNEIMYDGITGNQLDSNIFMGPTYYMRLKHMVKDKINFRALGPKNVLTRQTVQGRANDGGLRIGEMERDGVIGHGMSSFLKDSFMVRGDAYSVAVCNTTGSIAIYNAKQNKFYSPLLDGPVELNEPISEQSVITNVSKFGFSFSVIKIPYCLKLLIHELQSMNISMKLVTEDNVDQLSNMNYSMDLNNIATGATQPNSIHNKPRKHMTNLTINKAKILERQKKLNDINNRDSVASVDSVDSVYHPVSVSPNKVEFKKGDDVSYINDSKKMRKWTIAGIQNDENIAVVSYDLENISSVENEILDKTDERIVIHATIRDIVPYRTISEQTSPEYASNMDSEFNSVPEEDIEDISEYKIPTEPKISKDDSEIKDNVINITTENLSDIIESSKYDSILQPKSLIDDHKKTTNNDDGNNDGNNDGHDDGNDDGNDDRKNISI